MSERRVYTHVLSRRRSFVENDSELADRHLLLDTEHQPPSPDLEEAEYRYPPTGFRQALQHTSNVESSERGVDEPAAMESDMLDGLPSASSIGTPLLFRSTSAPRRHAQTMTRSSPQAPTRTLQSHGVLDRFFGFILPNNSWSKEMLTFAQTPAARDIIKCIVAYFVASLFTFNPTLSSLIYDVSGEGSGPSPSGHMVATIAVYFNPAKTIGAMMEANYFCLLGWFYAALSCLLSMALFWSTEFIPGWERVGTAFALVSIAGSMGTMAWMKAWMASLSFNVACSMTAIIIFSVIVREGGWETLVQVSITIFYGFIVSNVVCFLVWPTSAIKNTLTHMTETMDGFSGLVPELTDIFLDVERISDSEEGEREVTEAIMKYKRGFAILRKDLDEAKSEWLMRGLVDGSVSGLDGSARYGQDGKKAYEDTADTLNRLGQHLNGLWSGINFQRDVLRLAGASSSSRAVLEELARELSVPLRSLATASCATLSASRDLFLQALSGEFDAVGIEANDTAELVDGIKVALDNFAMLSDETLVRLFGKRSSGNQELDEMRSRFGGDGLGDRELLLGRGNEDVFIVYFFIFTLQEFVRELILLVDAVERLYNYEYHQRHLSWWMHVREAFSIIAHALGNPKSRYGALKSTLKTTVSAFMIPPHHRTPSAFPKPVAEMGQMDQTYPSLFGRINNGLWRAGNRLVQDDAKYAIKAGIATAMLASFAFWEGTREVFLAFWGDWALISFFIVISPTIGATNFLAWHRFIATLFGAFLAILLYSIFPDQGVVLALCGIFVAAPCFYVAIVMPKYLSGSRFALLSYNLTCLYSYNLREGDVWVLGVGLHRAVAVTVGVFWAAIVARFWWPSEARRELNKTLGELCQNMGWLYTKLVAFNSYVPDNGDHAGRGGADGTHQSRDGTSGPETADTWTRPMIETRTHGVPDSIYDFMSMELYLQMKLIDVQTLLGQAQHEARPKGPFPVDLYLGIVDSLQSILDRLHSMRCVTTKPEWHTSVRQNFIIPVNKERREMVGNIVLSFFTLASAFQLKAPLPPYLPPAEHSRLRLVQAIRQLDIVQNRSIQSSRELLFFAYALTMKGVTMELDRLGRYLQRAFGVAGQTRDEFEVLFTPAGRSHGEVGNGVIEHVA